MSILSTNTIQSLSGQKLLGTTGGILQVKSTYFSTPFTTSSLTFVDITGFYIDITPTSSSNKILIIGHISIGSTAGSSGHRIMCNGVDIYPNNPSTNRFSGWTEFCNGDVNVQRNSPFIFLHSPGSTSQQTYQLQCKCNDSGHSATVNRSGSDSSGFNYSYRSASSITVMEIVS